MRRISYSQTGDPDVLTLSEVPPPTPGRGEVVVEFHRGGVNPCDWRGRRHAPAGTAVDPPKVPGEDGSGVVHAVGEGVDRALLGARVWVWEASLTRGGSAQEYGALPADRVQLLPNSASFDLGASLGVPFITAHRCLTVHELGPARLGPGTLEGRTILVAGGAGAVGNATIQLARWSGATIITTVSGDYKARLAQAAGADLVLDYRTQDVAAEIRAFTPLGIDTIVEVAPFTNDDINGAVIADGGTLALFSVDSAPALPLTFLPLLSNNARVQFVMAFGIPAYAKANAVQDIDAALASGAIAVGPEAGLPLHHYPLEEAAAAHAAVENHTIGKVLLGIR